MEVKDLLQWCMETDVTLKLMPIQANLYIEICFEDSITVDQFFGLIEIIGIKDTGIKIDFSDSEFNLIIAKFD